MALIEPNSRVDFLSGIPFDPDYTNTMYFDTIADQEAYFTSHVVSTFERNSYVRVSSGVMKVGRNADVLGASVIAEIYNANYMRFKNTNFENKWFYAFVDDVIYINNNTVEVHYHLDVMQTWHFNYRFNQCMIDRQHTETDVVGRNTIPEDIEIGEYVFDHATEFNYEPTAIVVTAGDFGGTYADGVVIPGLSNNGKWFSGVHFYPFPLSNQQSVDALNDMLEAAYTDRDKLNTIIAVFVMPNVFAGAPYSVQEYTENIIPQGEAGYVIGSYHARNAKLMTYPYNMLYVTNYQGNHLELRYEFFADPSNCKLKIWGNLSTNPAMAIYPYNYKTTGDNFDEMMQVTGFPMCAWANDAYKAWLAQNAGTINLGIAGVAASWVRTGMNLKNAMDATKISLPSGQTTYSYSDKADKMFSTTGEALRDSLMATGALIARLRDHAVAPPTAHGNGNGNLQYQMGKMTFMWAHKHIREEYAKIVDDFFDMFGYAIHRIGIPNRNARPCYTFVKTANASMDGNIPVTDLRIIESVFDKGIRFWRTTATFGSFDPLVNNNAPVI